MKKIFLMMVTCIVISQYSFSPLVYADSGESEIQNAIEVEKFINNNLSNLGEEGGADSNVNVEKEGEFYKELIESIEVDKKEVEDKEDIKLELGEHQEKQLKAEVESEVVLEVIKESEQNIKNDEIEENNVENISTNDKNKINDVVQKNIENQEEVIMDYDSTLIDYYIVPESIGVNPLRYTINFSSESNLLEEFENKWENPDSCEIDDKQGCVENPKSQTGSFYTGGDVEIRKLVQPTENLGEYEISIAVRGKKIREETENKVCAVVVFDKSGSMGNGSKWDNAKKGAIAFSESLINANNKSYVGLVTFSTTATQSRSLQHEALTDNDFGTAKGGTNLHAGLIEAQKMLDSSADCLDAKQYVVVVSDGAPSLYDNEGSAYGCGNDDKSCTNFPNGGITSEGGTKCSSTSSCTEGNKPSVVTIDYADELKETGIEIFAIGYETDSTANEILAQVATEGEGHFIEGKSSSITEALDGIATSVNESLPGTNATVRDNLGATITIANGETTYDIAEITEDWNIHSFTVRIDPSIEGLQGTNNGASLEYTDYNGQHKILSIGEEETASVRRKYNDCSGDVPSGDHSLVGSGNYLQKREGNELVPDLINNNEAKWQYVETIPEGGLESCTWTCDGEGYIASGNTCELEKFGIKREINGTIIEEMYEYGSMPNFKRSTDRNPDVQYTYIFTGRSPEITAVTTGKKYTAVYDKILNKYSVKFSDENGNILDEQQIEYGTKPEYHGEVPVKANSGGISYIFTGRSPEITEVGGDVVYRPIFTTGEVKLDVRFLVDSGVNVEGSQTYFIIKYGGQVKELNVHKEGYKFIGRYDNSRFLGEPFDFSTELTGDINFYAKWESVKNGYSGGGTSQGGNSCTSGDCVGGSHEAPSDSPDSSKDAKPSNNALIIDTSKEIKPENTADYTKEEIEAYEYAYDMGITTINNIEEARLKKRITRAELAKMISVFAVKELGMTPDKTKDCSNFANSISGYNQEMQDFMITSCQLEIMGIHTVNYEAIPDFMPSKRVTRAEFGTVLSRIMWGNEYEGTNKNYYENHLKALKNKGIITQDDPNLQEFRSWVLQMLYRTSKLLKLGNA